MWSISLRKTPILLEANTSILPRVVLVCLFLVSLVRPVWATSPVFPSNDIYIQTEAECPQTRISVAWRQHWITTPAPGTNEDSPIFADHQISLDSVEVKIDGYRVKPELEQELLRFLRNVAELSSYNENIWKKHYKISNVGFNCYYDGRPADIEFLFRSGGEDIGVAAVDLVALNRKIQAGFTPAPYNTTRKHLPPSVYVFPGFREVAPGWGGWEDARAPDAGSAARQPNASPHKTEPLVKAAPKPASAKK